MQVSWSKDWKLRTLCPSRNPFQCALCRFGWMSSPQQPSLWSQFLKVKCCLFDWFVDRTSHWPAHGKGEVSPWQSRGIIRGKPARTRHLAELVETLFLEPGRHVDLKCIRESCGLILVPLRGIVCNLWPHITYTGTHSRIFQMFSFYLWRVYLSLSFSIFTLQWWLIYIGIWENQNIDKVIFNFEVNDWHLRSHKWE